METEKFVVKFDYNLEQLQKKVREEAEAKKRAEEEEAKKQEKNKKYQRWLKEHGCTQDTKEDFYIDSKTDVIILYKKVDVFTK